VQSTVLDVGEMACRLSLFGGIAALLATALTAPSQAAQVWLQNDSFTGGAFNCQIGFEADETVAAKFTALPADYPYQIQTARVLACGGGFDAYAVEIYADNEDQTAPPDGLLWSSPDAYILTGDNMFYDIDLSGQNITIDNGGIRVGLVNVNILDPVGFGSDLNGIVAHRNFVRDASGQWFFAENPPISIGGDFILRVLITTPDRYFVTGGGSGSQSLLRRYQREF
jgi:hypothetical protein